MASKTNTSNSHKKGKVIYKYNYITSNIHKGHTPANHHPHVHGLRKAADKGDWTTSGRIIPTIDFSCWVLQTETAGLSGQDPSALSLTKRVFSGLIRQKAYYWWSQPPPQLDKEKKVGHHWTGKVAWLFWGPLTLTLHFTNQKWCPYIQHPIVPGGCCKFTYTYVYLPSSPTGLMTSSTVCTPSSSLTLPLSLSLSGSMSFLWLLNDYNQR